MSQNLENHVSVFGAFALTIVGSLFKPGRDAGERDGGETAAHSRSQSMQDR